MDVLPLSNSIKLQSSKVGSSLMLTKAFKLNVVASSTTFKGNPKVNPSFVSDYSLQLLSNNHSYPKPMFQEFPFSPKELVVDKSLVNGPYYKAPMDEELEQEIASMIQKLTRAVEKVREAEMKKFLDRRKERANFEDTVSVEEMSKEIVAKFLEKPLQYLTSGNGNSKEKMRDLNLLLGMLESC